MVVVSRTVLLSLVLLIPGIVQASSNPIVLEPRVGASLAASRGQVCQNLFPEGDFGSVATLGAGPIQPDPAANPGVVFGPPLDSEVTTYTFGTSGTFGCAGDVGCWPFDGEYVILNNNRGMLNPPVTEDGWQYVEDNSPDPDGYWMLVNADETPGLFYKQEVVLVPGVSHTFEVDLINICSGETCEITPDIELVVAPAGTSDEDLAILPPFAVTGPITDFQWQTYGGDFIPEPPANNAEGAVILALRSIVPGGMGNDFGVDNITLTVCSGETVPPIEPIAVPLLSHPALLLMGLLIMLLSTTAIRARSR